MDSIDRPCTRAGWQVTTNGNPSSEVTSSILASVGLDRFMGLDETSWSVVKVFIDSQVLYERHKVAHGERFPVSKDDFYDRSSRVIRICDRLSKLIIDAAASRSYEIRPA